jgi:hypothetical protein
MQPDWVIAQGYQHSQTVVAAINDLMLGLKLKQRGVTSPRRERNTAAAREELRTFLGALENLAEQAEASADRPLVGATPSLCALAETLAEAYRRDSARPVGLRAERIGEIRMLLEAADPADQERLLAYLSNLRRLLEEWAEEEAGHIIAEP